MVLIANRLKYFQTDEQKVLLEHKSVGIAKRNIDMYKKAVEVAKIQAHAKLYTFRYIYATHIIQSQDGYQDCTRITWSFFNKNHRDLHTHNRQNEKRHKKSS